MGFPGISAGKESTCSAGDLGSIPGSGRATGEGIGYPLQYSGLENSTDCIFHKGLDTSERLSLSLRLQWLRLYASTMGHRSIPDQGTKALACCIEWPKNFKKTNQKNGIMFFLIDINFFLFSFLALSLYKELLFPSLTFVFFLMCLIILGCLFIFKNEGLKNSLETGSMGRAC